MATPTELLSETNDSSSATAVQEAERKGIFSAVVWTSFGFAVLQSVCTVLIGLGGARILISLLSVAAASSVLTRVDAFHQDGLRIPMMAFAVVGSVLNLIVVWQVRRLRSRPSAQWRLNVASLPKRLRQERWQVGLSIVTLILVVVEEAMHRGHVHRW